MTRHEKLSLGISTVALVISIVSPFLNYYWFQNEVRIRQLKSDAFVVEGNVYGCPTLQTIAFDFELKNAGVWPIENVQLTIQKTVDTFDLKDVHKLLKFVLDKQDIDPEPPLAILIQEKSRDIIVHLKDALPPKSDVGLGALQIRNVPPEQISILPDMESLWPRVWVS